MVIYAVRVLAFPVLRAFSSNSVQDKTAVEILSSEQCEYALVSAT